MRCYPVVSLLLVSRYHPNRTYRFPLKLTTRYISGAYYKSSITAFFQSLLLINDLEDVDF